MDRERRSFYPPGWRKISHDFRASKNFTCEHCQAKQGQERISRRTGVIYKVVVAAAHVDHTQRHNPDAPLKCLCQICHGKYDYEAMRREQRISLEHFKHRRLIGRQNEPFQRRSLV